MRFMEQLLRWKISLILLNFKHGKGILNKVYQRIPSYIKQTEIYTDINFIDDKNMFIFANYLCIMHRFPPQLLASDFWNLHTALTLECASGKNK